MAHVENKKKSTSRLEIQDLENDEPYRVTGKCVDVCRLFGLPFSSHAILSDLVLLFYGS